MTMETNHSQDMDENYKTTSPVYNFLLQYDVICCANSAFITLI